MKKWLMTLSLFLIMILFVNTLSFGENSIINVSMNGSTVKVREVPVMMDGQAFKSEVPSFVYIDRTLVPVRFIAESLGAKVDWDQKTKTATILQNNKTIKLTIDSTKAIVNNETKTLDKNSTPKLVTFSNKDSRTMVPVRVISEILGYEVGWNQENKIPYISTNNGEEDIIDFNPEVNPPVSSDLVSISDISIQKGSTPLQKVVIKSDEKIEYETLFLPDSNKLIIDIKNSKLNLKNTGNAPGNIQANDVNFSKVEYSQYSTNPYITRIVVTMNGKENYELIPSSDGKTTVLSFVKKVNGISLDTVAGKDALVIDGIGTSYNVLKLKDPERIVIDLLDATLNGKLYEDYNYELGFIKGVRTSQFLGDNNYSSLDRIVRVVLDVKEGITDPNIKVDTLNNKLVVYPEKSFWENISYASQGLDKILTINNLEKTKYEVDYDFNNKLMKITIPTENVELENGYVTIKDGIVDNIEVVKDKEETKVLLSLKSNLEFTVLSDRKDTKVQILLKRDPNSIDINKTIVIDAGHGDTDPGAMSVSGTKEKDINLQIAKKLESQLNALGYNVLMTRTGDQKPSVYDRANFANAANADLFVSIHSNSHTNRDIKGLQVLYCPLFDSKVKTVDQYPFAESIFKAVLESTGAVDKGIIKRKDLPVVRETKMPAVLVEVGFLSNAEEEKLITSDSYQNKIVEGIIKGIQNYIEMY
ncbi:N-acetylmuramoyl-L-alanine amidase family protein [Paratissierella segnis]|jgi:N-acetylmuramoyl-L-alanine amidase|uniref:N-acetylmuramoyl-L-alanine amidase n=1 Tax=Paratissierella segnis TaxID=2763679 RepID=A0A926IDX9_9FIRM|nr:N-acetylmuramoyl-L-alanine amidase family protein [Paratissierella segnis]MBC8586767.1 N-acetylmuramoyl-L-alanine amidase [Paratissierella segnis]